MLGEIAAHSLLVLGRDRHAAPPRGVGHLPHRNSRLDIAGPARPDHHRHPGSIQLRSSKASSVDVKHAGAETLAQLEPLIASLRQVSGLREQKTGIFYRGSRAFLHFHEDPAGLFADVRLSETFERFEVTTTQQQQALVRRIQDSVNAQTLNVRRTR